MCEALRMYNNPNGITDRTSKAAGGVITGLLAVACGWMGEKHHIGFTVASRFSWGMRGSYCTFSLRASNPGSSSLTVTVPVIIRIFVACMWFGMQSYWYCLHPVPSIKIEV